MTKYKYHECVPRNTGFYRVYDKAGHCFAAYYFCRAFEIGPRLDKDDSLTIVPPIHEPYEWEEWT